MACLQLIDNDHHYTVNYTYSVDYSICECTYVVSEYAVDKILELITAMLEHHKISVITIIRGREIQFTTRFSIDDINRIIKGVLVIHQKFMEH